MYHYKSKYQPNICQTIFILVLAMLLSTIGLSGILTLTASANTHAKPPYVFCFESISGINGSQSSANTTLIFENYALDIGASIELKGWLATDEGVDHYEYAWVSVQGGVPNWQTPQNQTIIPRKDLAATNVSYPTGHATAGFAMTIPSNPDMVDGQYDLYVRAVTGGDVTCDILVLLNVVYGAPDLTRNGIYHISFPRLTREEGALVNSSVEGQDLQLGADGMVHLGWLDTKLFENVKITYSIPETFQTEKQAILGFKSSPDHTYGNGTGKYNMTNNILYLPIDTEKRDNPQEVILNLRDAEIFFDGDIYLCGYTSGEVNIHSIEMTYLDQGHTRTAAKIRFAENLSPYFTGYNKVEISGVKDPVMGDVLRISLTEDTNDPFVSFLAEPLMKEYDIRLNADEYKYMVVLARIAPHNAGDHMTFYLCAGQITGATENCTYTFTPKKDGMWHYYLIDLSQKDTWKGTIHNWRFDIINGDSKAGDYVDIATVQFFRTAKAANNAAQASTTTCDTPYDLTLPSVIQDMQEESLEDDSSYIIPEEDYFVVTEPETQPPIETETLPPTITTSPDETTNSPIVSDAPIDSSPETAPEKSGCTSVLHLFPVIICTLLALTTLCYATYKQQKRRTHT